MRALAQRAALGAAAPVSAALLAVLVAAFVLAASGHSPWHTFTVMADYARTPESIVSAVNRAVPYFLAGLAVAVGFRMKLFNIGVEGQYRLGALSGAAVGAVIHLPGPLHVAVIVATAVAAGAAWAGLAAWLKVTRGVNEVISTLMLNYIATALAAYLLAEHLAAAGTGTATRTLPESGRMPSLNPVLAAFGLRLAPTVALWGFLAVAVAIGIGVHYLLTRTWYGYQVRASGLNADAATANGIDPRRMTVLTLLLSGGLAGLAGLPFLLGQSHNYGLDFPAGIGFTGIAVALLGRNQPAGIAAAALLFGFLERSAQILDLEGIPKEIVTIMQGVIVLSVVIAYELVKRFTARQTARAVRVRREAPARRTEREVAL
ncbi:nucleoside ABC transporter membrane protein [Actinomadura pelletieri DSM 43383]|uniref:Nucleoside ABC transporter membrane protein n=1 Tax=Actinomadura pelletieri DSM 43383 TaxID=1120940 RepID=A0A495QXX3_9ACTN|nr:ABC transporter permease [Actinomadura pelletieri]RKS78766.1 nucleoside ABC transporter membrane protein [Actinomadura pelletieri DSM 43383]